MTIEQRTFYEMAAAVAHQGMDFIKHIRDEPQPEDFMLRSSFLERDYQDCLFAFAARGARMADPAINSIAVVSAINKFCEGITLGDAEPYFALNAASFAKDLALARQRAMLLLDWPDQSLIRENRLFSKNEIMALFLWVSRETLQSFASVDPLPMSAQHFHEQITKMASNKSRRPFMFSGTYGEQHFEMPIDRASLFSANRLIKKSWQNSMGAEPGMRYYHAALRSKLEPGALDVVYWLSFDEDHQIRAGEFIDINQTEEHMKLFARLSSPLEKIKEIAAQNPRLGEGIKVPERVIEVFSMYLDSLYA